MHDRYIARIPFHDDGVVAAAVVCSDGRYCEQMEEFIHQSLHLPQYDCLAIPGGVAALAGHTHASTEGSAIERQLRFLIEAHGLTRVVLIAHQDCGFYEQAGLGGQSLIDTQRADIWTAAERLRSWHHDLVIEAFYAQKIGAEVSFEPWPLTEPAVIAALHSDHAERLQMLPGL